MTDTSRVKKEEKKGMSEYMDVGANLGHPKFKSDLESVLEYSKSRGIHHLMVITNQLHDVHRHINLCKNHPGFLHTTIGMHPHHADSWDSKTHLPEMRSALRKYPQVIKAIGETGLDYNRMFSSQRKQMEAFEAQVALACETKVPLFLHEREAHHDLMSVLTKYRSRLPRVLIHCFTGSEKELETYVQWGFFIGISGHITKTEGENLRKCIHKIPITHILLETDAPFMIPYQASDMLMDPRRNEPCTIPVIAHVAREHYNTNMKKDNPTFVPLSASQMSDVTRKNSKAFFSIV
jgi:TatD DNase family protein